MKLSKYNFFYEYKKDPNKYVAYNSFSNSLALLERQKYIQLQEFASGKIEGLDNTFEQELMKGNFLIGDEINELEILEHRMNKSRYGSGILGLTIAPTLNCNFRCIYCYEKGRYKNSKMDEETEEAIVEFVCRYIPKITGIAVSWYGGEPLLVFDVIERLSERLIKIAREHKLWYSAGMVTNGYLLTKGKAQRMAELGVKNIQITIDGNKKTHNQKRPLVDGSGTYSRIFENLEEVNGILESVAIRVNTDKNNPYAITSVCEEIKKRKLVNVVAYPAPIRGTEDCYNIDSCIGKTEFFNLEYEVLKTFPKKEYIRYIQQKYPILSGNSCGADSDLAFVIDADGNLYKCWSDIGNDSVRFGNIKTGEWNVQNEIIYIKDKPMDRDICRECRLLPICLGGCPYEVRQGVQDKCIYSEKLLGNYLQDIACEMERASS